MTREGWEEHRREQLRAILKATTPSQRLAWLEEAIRFAAKVGALPRRELGELDDPAGRDLS